MHFSRIHTQVILISAAVGLCAGLAATAGAAGATQDPAEASMVSAGGAGGAAGAPGAAEARDAVLSAVPRVVPETAWIVFDEIAQLERLVSAGHHSAPGAVVPAGARAQLHTVRFRFEGAEPVPALRVEQLVPPGGRYLVGSATGPGARIFVSVDGGRTFLPEAELRPEDTVSIVRFELPGPFIPGTAGLVSFRTAWAVEQAAEVAE